MALGASSASLYSTRPSLLLRINASDAKPREIAWQEFRDRYARVIAGFARNLGARPADVDDVIQDVLLGFFANSAQFVYDPSKGRFRGYLKVCTLRALQRRIGQNNKFRAVPLDDIDVEDEEIDLIWNHEWAARRLDRALATVREQYKGNKTFQAFHEYVVRAKAPEQVALELRISVASVYKAKARISDALRSVMQRLDDEEG
jgi:RNA polymerase sigma factor (sigma-70 family)